MKAKVYKVWDRTDGRYKFIKMPDFKYGESNTDKSKYRPNVSDLTGARATDVFAGEFDFKDGNDDNAPRMYLLRNKGADIVDLKNTANRMIEIGKEIKNKFDNKVIENAEKKLSEMNKGKEPTNEKTTGTEE